MKPFLIRKCGDCGNWHLWVIIDLGPFFIPQQIHTTKTFGEMLIDINESDLSDLYA